MPSISILVLQFCLLEAQTDDSFAIARNRCGSLLRCVCDSPNGILSVLSPRRRLTWGSQSADQRQTQDGGGLSNAGHSKRGAALIKPHWGEGPGATGHRVFDPSQSGSAVNVRVNSTPPASGSIGHSMVLFSRC